MSVNKKSGSNLELPIILDKVKAYCESKEGQLLVDRLSIYKEADGLRHELDCVKEMMVLDQEKELSFSEGLNEEIWDYSAISGAALGAKELYEVHGILASFFHLKGCFFGKGKAVYPTLSKEVIQLEVPSELYERLQSVFNEEGEIRDTASEELYKVRKSIIKKRESVRSKVGTVLKEFKAKGYCEEQALPTFYHNRLVLPIISSVKRTLPGLIHGASKTGQQVYFEPAEIVEDNNEMAALSFEENKALLEIFSELTMMVSNEKLEIIKIESLLAKMDFRRAKARFGRSIGGQVPQINGTGVLDIKEGKNPLLLLNDMDPVPLTLKLGEGCSWLVISGPNAGGKTVTLKTIGLLSLMVQSGIPVPCSPKSSFCLFDELFVEIGDTQSVDDALSTYSGHLSHLKTIIDSSTSKSLVLIDELGSGTSPEFGGVIGSVLLKEIFSKKGLGCVTSHFNELKYFGEDEPEVLQGSMGYDLEEMKPLFTLNVGLSGQSYAIELMKRIGFNGTVVDSVTKGVDEDVIKYDDLIKELNKKNDELSEQLKQAKKKRKNLEVQIAEYEEAKMRQEDLIEEKMERFKLQEVDKLKETEKELQELLKSARNSSKEAEIRQGLSKVSEKGKKLKKKTQPKAVQNEVANHETGPIEEGDHVIASSGFKGLVALIKGKNATVNNGQMQMTVPLKELVLSREKHKSTAKPKKKTIDVVQKSASFSSNLDIRGMRAEEVYAVLERFMDDAFVANADRLRILHGKGGGVLRDLVQRFLKEEPAVKEVKHEEPDQGGDGVTIAIL